MSEAIDNTAGIKAGARVYFAGIFASSSPLDLAVDELPKAVETMRNQVVTQSSWLDTDAVYHREAPRAQIDPACQHVLYRLDYAVGQLHNDKEQSKIRYIHAREIRLDVKTIGIRYAFTAKELAMRLIAGIPLETRKGAAAHYALQIAIRDQFRTMAAPYKSAFPGSLRRGREYDWEHAEMLMANDFTQLPSYWAVDKNPGFTYGQPILITPCTARFAGLAVYS